MHLTSNHTKEQCEGIFANMTLTTQQAVVALLMELEAARLEHPKWPIGRDINVSFLPMLRDQTIADFVTAAAIVAEESGELLKSALEFHFHDGSYTDMQNEAVQTGAMALRFLVESPEVNI